MNMSDILLKLKNRATPITVVVVFIVLALLPLTGERYYMYLMTVVFINVILAASLRLTLITGQFNVGHPAFMAIGAYTAVICARSLGVPTGVSLLIGGLAPALVSVLIGRTVLRLRGVYFALVTIALVEVVRVAISRGGKVTGGHVGVRDMPPFSVFGWDIGGTQDFYIFGFILVVISLFVLYRIEASRIGLTWKAISQSEELASMSGVNAMAYKTAAFAIGSFFAGVAGAYLAYFSRFLVPTMFDFNMAVNILIFNYVGGLGTIMGPALGASFMTLISEPFKGLPQYETIFFGAILILVIVILPGGLITLPDRLRSISLPFGAKRAKAPT